MTVPLDDVQIPSPEVEDDRLLDLHEALDKFGALYPQKAELVKLRYFVGMTVEEAAGVLGIAVPTAKPNGRSSYFFMPGSTCPALLCFWFDGRPNGEAQY